MKRFLIIVGLLVILGLLITACISPRSSIETLHPSNITVLQESATATPAPEEESAELSIQPLDFAAPDFVGSESCAECHQDIYDSFMLTGHPYKLNKVVDGQPPKYPFSEVPNPPEGYTWDDILYVIGGYGWKARFINKDGFIITGDEDATTQYNLYNEDLKMGENWVAYHAGEERPYNCGSCHTTAYSPEGNQDGLPGLIGTWVEDGIGCEECHGPGSQHIQAPIRVSMEVETDSRLCGKCHRRGEDITDIDASGGFIRHHEQYEELFASKKRVMNCVDCHNPHESTVYAPEIAIKADCERCHFDKAKYQKITDRRHAQCIDCHMPRVSKSALADPDIFSGDLRTHLMAINPDATSQFDEEGKMTQPYLALDFACNSCHSEAGRADVIPEQDLVEFATGYHNRDQAGSLNRR